MQARDPKGYYTQLGVPHTASAAEIKQAFRRLALHVHPDRNTSTAAEEALQQLVHAYDVLSHPDKRAAYDAQCIDLPPSTSGGRKSATAPQPLVCAVCGRIPIQPKYVIFYEVKSFIWTSIRMPIQGIYCRKCADKRLLRATLVTWLLGWWGMPWGPFYTVHALMQNVLGGRRPYETNARILGYQAWYFASIGKMFLARALAIMALELSTDHGLCASLQPFLPPSGEQSRRRPIHRLKNAWEWRGSAFLLQSVCLLCITSGGMFLFARSNALLQSPSVALYQDYARGHSPAFAAPEAPQAVPLARHAALETPVNVGPRPLQDPPSALTNAWYISANSLRLRAGPGVDYPVLGVLERFETVTIMGQPIQGEWVPVQTANGTAGFVAKQYLTEGNGTTAKRQWCQEHQDISTPSHTAPAPKRQRDPRC